MLTKHNWLLKYNNLNGNLLQEIYLGHETKRKFLHINWETTGESIAIESGYSPFTKTIENERCRVLKSVIIFNLYPLKFSAHFEIDRKVRS